MSRPRAVFDQVWCDHGSFYNGLNGMIIHSKFKTYNLYNKPIQLIAYFFDENGRKLIDNDGIDRSDDGQVSVAGQTEYSPYESTQFQDYKIFMPYNQLDIYETGKFNLKFYIQVYDKEEKRFLGTSDPVGFVLQRGAQ
jgi:hypothetical protein